MLNIYNLFYHFKNNSNIDYLKNIYFFIFLFFLLAFNNLLFLNEEIIICISIILYFFGLLLVIRKIILVYFFTGSELLYLLFFLLIILNIIYVKININFLNIKYFGFFICNKERFNILLSIFALNYYYFLLYYVLNFKYFISILSLKNENSNLKFFDNMYEIGQLNQNNNLCVVDLNYNMKQIIFYFNYIRTLVNRLIDIYVS
jgi:hypothetical protein